MCCGKQGLEKEAKAGRREPGVIPVTGLGLGLARARTGPYVRLVGVARSHDQVVRSTPVGTVPTRLDLYGLEEACRSWLKLLLRVRVRSRRGGFPVGHD